MLVIGLSEASAFAKEIEMISMIGRYDLKKGPLCNFTNGGEGGSGCISSEKTKRKKRKALEKRVYKPLSEEQKSAIGLGNTGKVRSEEFKNRVSMQFKGRHLSKNHRKKISASLTGKKRGPLSMEHKLKVGVATKRRHETEIENPVKRPEVRAKISATLKGTRTGDENSAKRPEVREKISIALRGKKQSDEHIRHIIESRKRNQEAKKINEEEL